MKKLLLVLCVFPAFMASANQDFFQALRDANIPKLESFLKDGIYPNLKTRDGSTALHITATESNSPEAPRLLFKYGADFNAKDIYGRSPLHRAAEAGKFDMVKIFIELGADVHARDYSGRTVLHYSAAKGHLEITDLFLEKGVDVNAIDGYNRSVFYQAMHAKHFKLADSLIEHGANIDLTDNFGRTLLHHAVKDYDIWLVEYLLEKGADPNIKDFSGNTALHEVFSVDKIESQRWQTMFHIMETLFKYKADPHAVNNKGEKARDLVKKIKKEEPLENLKGRRQISEEVELKRGIYSQLDFYERMLWVKRAIFGAGVFIVGTACFQAFL